MATYDVYNLVFPDGIYEMEIFGYRFKRVEKEYPNRLQDLYQPVNISTEFSIKQNNGNHAITATVEVPDKPRKSILEWSGTSENWEIFDITLLLSLFTGRNVFLKISKKEEIIIADYRTYQYGGSLRTSLKQEFESIGGTKRNADKGFERSLTEIYELMRTPTWQEKYGKGFFLFLLKSAFQQQILETSFILCWTIWEHLFTLHNQKWLSDEKIEKMSGADKISFIFTEYGLFDKIDTESKKVVKSFNLTRNRLIHFGKFLENKTSITDADLFIRLTELVVAKILELEQRDIFNTDRKLKDRITAITKKTK